jgi:transglutaminase-like putative cysteine protease
MAKRLGGGLIEPTLFRFDFSQYVKLDSQIEVSDELVMLFRKEGPADRILLRRFTLSEYSPERGFFQTQKKEIERIPYVVADTPENLQDPGYRGRAEVQQEYFFINFDPTSLIGMNYPVRIRPLNNWNDSSFIRIYRVDSKVSTLTPFDLREVDPKPMDGKSMEFYTKYGDDEQIRDLARDITAGRTTYYGKIAAIRDYLRDNFLYSLRPGIAEDGDQLKHFLFSSHKGYCSYFAFAMALMVRSIGIPARVAVGFLVDPAKEVLNFYEIRAYQAHAWVEVYFGESGWIEFDPTTQNLAPDQDIRLLFDFDFERFASLIEEILDNRSAMTERTASGSMLSTRFRGVGRSIISGFDFLLRFWYLTLPSLYILLLSFLKLRPYICFQLAVIPRNRIKYLFRFSLNLLYSIGWKRHMDESLTEYAARLSREHGLDLSPWTSHYLMAVFTREYRETDLSKGLSAYKSFKTSLKEILPVLRRFSGHLVPLGTLRRRV